MDLLQGGGVRLHVEYVDLVYRALHDLSEVPRVAFGEGRSLQSGIALRVELDPLIRRVARKRLIRTAAMRRRDRLILAVAGHHLGRSFEGVETTVEWSPVLAEDALGGAPAPSPVPVTRDTEREAGHEVGADAA